LATSIEQNLQQEFCAETTCNIILMQKRKDLYCTEDNADVATHSFASQLCIFENYFAFKNTFIWS